MATTSSASRSCFALFISLPISAIYNQIIIELIGTKISFMKLKILFIATFALVFSSLNAQHEDPKLKKILTTAVQGFKGDVGIYVKHLPSGKMAMINADTIFPTASMIKIPITIGMFQKIDKNELDYHSTLVYKDSLLYAGEDILGSFKNGEKISLSKLLMLMVTTSDNTASLWC